MRLMRLRFTGNENATRQLLEQIALVDGVERVEEVAGLAQQLDEPDFCLIGLALDDGSSPHAIEVEVTDVQVRNVRMMANRVASVTGSAREIEQDDNALPVGQQPRSESPKKFTLG